jgi:hypothetical protein
MERRPFKACECTIREPMGRFDPLIRRAFLAAAVVWAAMLFAVPPLTKAGTGLADVIAFSVYVTASAICHQRPERSFDLFGVQMPVCARCTGIYVGAAVAAIAVAWIASGTEVAGNLRPRRTLRGRRFLATSVPGRWPAWAIALASTGPSLATLVYEWTTGDMPSNWIRAASGVPMGVVVSWLVLRPVDDALPGLRLSKVE